MKMMFCQDCGTLVVPDSTARKARSCDCGRHSVWWENPRSGELRLHDRYTPPDHIRSNRYPSQPRAYVLGLTNSLLMHPQQSLNAEVYQQIIDGHDDSYLFKRVRSCIIRIRPGESGDTGWSPELPA